MIIRKIRASLSLLLSVAALALAPAPPVCAAPTAADRMELPAPDKTGGMPLMQALAERKSTKKSFSGASLSAQQLSDLLWATWGVNRADGRRTAPTGMNRQDVQVYVALENGVWRYEKEHALVKVLDGDQRAAMGGGSLTLLYAAPESNQWSPMHVGSLYQNAGLYCASAGLGSYVHVSGLHTLDGKLGLPEGWRVLIIQTVGAMP
jgi:hypothetical protein